MLSETARRNKEMRMVMDKTIMIDYLNWIAL